MRESTPRKVSNGGSGGLQCAPVSVCVCPGQLSKGGLAPCLEPLDDRLYPGGTLTITP